AGLLVCSDIFFISRTNNQVNVFEDLLCLYCRMNMYVGLLAVGITLCLQCQVDAGVKLVIPLLKQPSGLSREAVRAADYMQNTLSLLRGALEKRQKRSINATDLITVEDLNVIAKLTGCATQIRPPSCKDISKSFRTAASSCNNLKNPRWGSSNIPFLRWLPAEYEDDLTSPKGWTSDLRVNYHLLPLVREVSNRILATTNEDVESDPLYSHLVTIFGQWTDHDLTLTPNSPSIVSFNNNINCETSCARTEPCFPIEIPSNDERFQEDPKECLPFSRSAPACGSGNTGHIFGASTLRHQMNTLTSFIDAGQVYGSDEAKAQRLRDLSTEEGLMKVNPEFDDNGRALLPFTGSNASICNTRARITKDPNARELDCFLAGDVRSNENIGLASLHTLMVREHNRLARALANLNPNWDGNRLYQEARKIMGGYMQVITYRDYLRHILGPEVMSKQLSTYPGYDENVDPSIANVFATAAYRFAHLMVQPFMFRLDENYENHADYPSELLHRTMFTPWRIAFEGGLDPILRGLVGRPAKLNTQDHMLTEELRNRLFKFSVDLAMDLGSLNMQRGRDHGLPGYNKWRGFCGLSQPQNLEELATVLNNTDLAEKLMDLYGTPDNIDIWLGGVAEPFVAGGRVGPLFACMISTQFKRIRQGDRFWWENDGVFTGAQRRSLRDASLARIICDNTGITEVPDQPFQYRPRGSGYSQCKDLPAFDLKPWAENCELVVDLLQNGKLILHSYTTQQNGYVSASGSTFIKLQRGDKVWLVANNGGNGLTSDSYFSGHLLFAE
uniref:Eosinophil peroxidase n=1 Tax=Oryzias sinensis TaxID=183150 RepID=A0A8C7Z8F6_9TELE